MNDSLIDHPPKCDRNFVFAHFVGSLTPEAVISGTGIASAAFGKGKVAILVEAGREADGVVGGQEALFAECVEVERTTVVAILNFEKYYFVTELTY